MPFHNSKSPNFKSSVRSGLTVQSSTDYKMKGETNGVLAFEAQNNFGMVRGRRWEKFMHRLKLPPISIGFFFIRLSPTPAGMCSPPPSRWRKESGSEVAHSLARALRKSDSIVGSLAKSFGLMLACDLKLRLPPTCWWEMSACMMRPGRWWLKRSGRGCGIWILPSNWNRLKWTTGSMNLAGR